MKIEKRGGRLGSYRADIMIAADGIHSAVRKFYYPNEGLPEFSGRILWRGITENFLLAKGKEEELRKTLNKIDPKLNLDSKTKFERNVVKEKGSPLVKLLERKRSLSTIMFWISCFCCFALIYALNTWLPKLILQAGYSLSSSLVFVTGILNR